MPPFEYPQLSASWIIIWKIRAKHAAGFPIKFSSKASYVMTLKTNDGKGGGTSV